MADANATFSKGVAEKRDYRGRGSVHARFAYHFRKFVVAASLISGDILAAIVAVSLNRTVMAPAGIEFPRAREMLVALLILILFAVGLYSGTGPSPYERLRLRALAVAGFVAINLLLGMPTDQPGRFLVGELCGGFLLLLFGHYTEVLVRSSLIRLRLWAAPTVLVGCDGPNLELARLLENQPDLGLRPVAFIATPEDQNVQVSRLALPLLGTATQPRRIGVIEVAIFNSAQGLAAAASGSSPWIGSSCKLLFVQNSHDIQSLWLRTRMLGGAIGIEVRRDYFRRYNRVFKRILDLALTVPLALLSAPLVAVLALVIKLVDRGPSFYVQERVGHNGATLRVIKLRTMHVDAESRLEEYLHHNPEAREKWQRYFKLDPDPRLLPVVGSFMRRTSIDELPQLWNVLRGDMSLVGPRPFPPYHVRSFDPEFQAIRRSVQPGITGMWQVSSRSDGDLQVQKAQDLFYIRNWSIWLDVYILIQTVLVVLSGKGAR